MSILWRLLNGGVVHSGEGGGGAGAGAGGEGGGAAAGAAATGAAAAAATTVTGSIVSDAAAAAGAEGKATETKGADTKAAVVEATPADARAWLLANTKDGETDAGKALIAGKTDAEVLELAKAGREAAEKAGGAPIEYGDFVFPEGVEVDKATLTEATALFQEAKLPKELAQKHIDLHSKVLQGFADSIGENWVRTNQKWQADFRADKEIGGAREQATIDYLKQAVTKFGTPGLREALIITGAGNHPEVIRFIARVGAATGEGTHVQAGQGAAASVPAPVVLYPTMHKGT